MKGPDSESVERQGSDLCLPRRDAVKFIRYHPPGPLDRYIACFWWSRRDTPQECCEHILPSGGVQLVFALHDTPIICMPGPPSTQRIEWSHTLVHGPQWRHYTAGPKPRGATVGVAFRAGAAAAVLGVGMTDLAGHHVTLSTLWGSPGQDLHERLMVAADPIDIFHILERDLNARLRPSLLMHPAVSRALNSCSPTRPPPRVADVQLESGYSPRHFIALFRAAVGLTPKHYYRIQRFNNVARCLAAEGQCDLAELAASVGYSDQAHLTRDFREFAGVTPTQYRPGGSDRHLHHRATVQLGRHAR
jgi:AraC-like DNA-binding protein